MGRLVRVRFSVAFLFVAFVALLVGLAACGSGGAAGASDGDAGLGSETGTSAGRHAVGGSVVGLEGASVTVALSTGEPLTLSTDGPFRFNTSFAQGDAYAVALSKSPAGHICSILNGSGTVGQADVTNITVSCPSTDSALTDLSLSSGPLTTPFAPATTMYTAGALADATSLVSLQPATKITLTATPRSPGARLAFKGAPLAAAKPSAPFGIGYGPNVLSVVVTAADGVSKTTYTIALNGTLGTQEAYIKAATQPGFSSISLSGDTLAVGDTSDQSNATGINGNPADTSAANSGAVYIFVRSGSTWTQQAYIKASNTKPGQNFGTSVSLDGDTLAVGADSESSNATGVNGDQADTSAKSAGAVYVFVRSGNTWTQQAYVKASNTAAGAALGGQLALSGNTLAVAALGESSNATGINGDQTNHSVNNAGAVYVFVRSGTSWTQEAYVKASNTKGIGALFGSSVSLFGDTLAVGAVGEASSATGLNGDQADISQGGAGAVYVFVRSGTTWAQQAYVKASNTASVPTSYGQQFGSSVSLSSDTLAVGALGEASSLTGTNHTGAWDPATSNAAPGAGAVYVFVRSGSAWTQQAYIKASNTLAPDKNKNGNYLGPGVGQQFGTSVSLSGDVLAVGAAYEWGGATGINGNQFDVSNGYPYYAGAVYVFARSGAAWTQRAYVKPSSTQKAQAFGSSASLSGDTLAVGAQYDGAYIFR